MSRVNEAATNKQTLVVKIAGAIQSSKGNVSAKDVVNALELKGIEMTVNSVRRYAGLGGFSFSGSRGNLYTEADIATIVAEMSRDYPPTQKELAKLLGRSVASIGYKVRVLREKGILTEITGRGAQDERVAELLAADDFNFDDALAELTEEDDVLEPVEEDGVLEPAEEDDVLEPAEEDDVLEPAEEDDVPEPAEEDASGIVAELTE